MPVAPVVVCVILGDMAVRIQSVGVDDGPLTVLSGVTVIVPVALNVPQPPVNGMLYIKVPAYCWRTADGDCIVSKTSRNTSR